MATARIIDGKVFQNQRLAAEFVYNDLYDYVQGMGYDWNQVCYVRNLTKVMV